MKRTENFDKGVALRRQLGGDELVDKAFSDPEDFSYPMEELVTEHAWGAIWSRPGLDRRTRSLLNIGMLAAMNRTEALAGHIGIALKNGVTREEIQECLLQVAVYAGMPAGMASFKVARQVLSNK
ncbi:MAG: 4-carboxymuconolactone decarboxylase [Rhodoferax sp.]|nr:4-carboxymuconolactone decarboxylase [Rhodoferax sp.]